MSIKINDIYIQIRLKNGKQHFTREYIQFDGNKIHIEEVVDFSKPYDMNSISININDIEDINRKIFSDPFAVFA